MTTRPNGPELAADLIDLVVGTLDVLIEHHLPAFRIPGAFAGHRVEPDVAADLVYTLGHLADAGVEQVAGTGIDEAIATVLRRIDGPNTHTFFSYRVAETLARYGSFADNRLIADWDQASRDNLAEACDTSTWIPLLDLGLPRNYAAVLSRCEVGRQALGLLGDSAEETAGVDALVDRARTLLSGNPLHHLDDSTHHIGRYDIYAADVWLFTEPLADRLGPLWAEGLATALGLVEVVGSPDGTAVGWGRSTGVLSAALTIELAALAVAGGPHRSARALAAPGRRRHRQPRPVVPRRAHHRAPAPSTYEYRGPVPAPAAHARHPRASWRGRPRSWPQSIRGLAAGRRGGGLPLAGPAGSLRGRAGRRGVGPPQPGRRAGHPVRRRHPQRLPARAPPAAGSSRCRSTRAWCAGCRWSTPGAAHLDGGRHPGRGRRPRRRGHGPVGQPRPAGRARPSGRVDAGGRVPAQAPAGVVHRRAGRSRVGRSASTSPLDACSGGSARCGHRARPRDRRTPACG